MLIKDEGSIKRIQAGDAREEHRADIADGVSLKTAGEVRDFENSPTNPLRQWANPMGAPAFEAKLKKILPDFCRILHHPKNPGLKCLYVVTPTGELEYIMSWPFPVLPEWSICYTYTEDVPDMSVSHIDKKDLPPHEYISPEEGFDFDTSKAPLVGMKRVTLMGEEAIRGWRVVLMQMVRYAIITPVQAETEFGISDRQEWAHMMGRYNAPKIWCQ